MKIWPSSGWWRLLLTAVFVVAAAFGGLAISRRGGPPNLATAQVTRGDYVEFIEIRGEIRPIKSVIVTAPIQSGELGILKIVPNGTAVKKDDVVIVFDESTIRRTIQERQSEMRQANAELDQFRAQARIAEQQDSTALMHANYDVERAKLGLGDPRISARIETERARLALADSEGRLRESEALNRAHRANAVTDSESRLRRIAKAQAEIDRLETSIGALQVKAPSDGTVNIMPNYRLSSPMGSPPEYRPGDKAYPGAPVLELPDLSQVRLEARLDEADRGRLSAGQAATIRVDAVGDRQFQATVADISLLARVDFSSGWPPLKNFDLKLMFQDSDPRIRPGMSAAARIGVGRVADMLLVPAQAVFLIDGQPVVYVLRGRAFEPLVVEVVKRNREQAAIRGSVNAGDTVALTRPDQADKKESK